MLLYIKCTDEWRNEQLAEEVFLFLKGRDNMTEKLFNLLYYNFLSGKKAICLEIHKDSLQAMKKTIIHLKLYGLIDWTNIKELEERCKTF